MVTQESFLRALWGEDPGVAELTAIWKQPDDKKSTIKSFPFTYPESLPSLLDAAPRHNAYANVYFGVCLHGAAWPRKNSAGHMEYRGTEDNALRAGCIWADLDFEGAAHKGKTIHPDRARKLLSEFPFKPSVVVKSGGGIYPIWLLREPAEGDALWRVKAINTKIQEYFDSDTVADLARVLRLPGTVNHKYAHRPVCEVSFWRPDRRYTLDDFDILSPADAVTFKPHAPAPPRSGEPPSPGRRGASITLSTEAVEKIKHLLSEIWLMGWRHRLALYFGGLCVHAGIEEEQACDIVRSVSDFVKGGTEDRLKDVRDTYRRFEEDKKIAGGPALEKMIGEEFPAIINQRAKKIFEIIRRAIPRPVTPGGGHGERRYAPPDFKPIRRIKYNSRPAIHVIVIQKEAHEFAIQGETKDIENFRNFRRLFWEEADCTIAPIGQRQWEMLLDKTPVEVRPAPDEASIPGMVQTELHLFLDQRKERPEFGELRAYAGYDDEHEYFNWNTFKSYLRDRGVRPENHILSEILEKLGWKTNIKRFGERRVRLWMRDLHSNGQEGGANGNGHPTTKNVDIFGEVPTNDPPPQETPPENPL